VDAKEIAAWEKEFPQPFDRSAYLGLYKDPSHEPVEEDKVHYIETLAREGLKGIGHRGFISSTGIPRSELPRWDDIQILTSSKIIFQFRPSAPMQFQCRMRHCRRLDVSACAPVVRTTVRWGLPLKNNI